MVDVETSEILHSKEATGQISNWLVIKTELAINLAAALNNPIDISERSKITLNTLTGYSDVIENLDFGKTNLAHSKLRLLELADIDSKYLVQLENQVTGLRLITEYEDFKSKLVESTLKCTILSDLVTLVNDISGWGATHEGGFKLVEFFASDTKGKNEALLFLKELNERRYPIGLPLYKSCTEYQDDVYKRVLMFNEVVDLIVNKNMRLNCERNITEFALGMMLNVVSQNFRVVSTTSTPNRHETMFEIYKAYYAKLLAINPNSFELQFSSFSSFKKSYESYKREVETLLGNKN